MTSFRRIRSLKPKLGTLTRITVEIGGKSFSVNQNTLRLFKTGEQAKAALEQFLGYPIPDIWFHINRDGTWAVATGANPPEVWPEDAVEVE